MNKIKNCHVIVCGPAIGKTYLAEHDKRFIDLDGEKAKYKYGLFNATSQELESGKLNRGSIVNKDSTDYAIEILEKEIKNNRIILISYSEKLLNYITKNKIDYCLVYASQNLALEYAERMKKRGNPPEFINQMTNEISWNKFYKDNKSSDGAKYKIELESGQYLSDFADLFFN